MQWAAHCLLRHFFWLSDINAARNAKLFKLEIIAMMVMMVMAGLAVKMGMLVGVVTGNQVDHTTPAISSIAKAVDQSLEVGHLLPSLWAEEIISDPPFISHPQIFQKIN